MPTGDVTSGAALHDYQQLVSGCTLIGLKHVNKLQQRRLDTIRIISRASALNVTTGVRFRGGMFRLS